MGVFKKSGHDKNKERARQLAEANDQEAGGDDKKIYGVVEVTSEGTKNFQGVEKSEVEKKREELREANIAKKEEARKQRRGSVATAPRVTKEELEEKRLAELEEKRSQRKKDIAATEQKRARRQSAVDIERKNAPTAKYSQKEIMILFDMFNEYDEDRGGFISVSEFKGHFAKVNEANNRYDGTRKNFAQRRAARAGLDLAQLVEPMFNSLDVDNSGTVTFFELLKVLYPNANEQDFETFKEWCYPPEPVVKKINYVLSDDQRAELRAMFRLFDTNKDGDLTVCEIKNALQGSAITGETGIEFDELQKYFDEADFDGDKSINLPEFEKLMMSTGLYVPETVETEEQEAKRLREEAARAAA